MELVAVIPVSHHTPGRIPVQSGVSRSPLTPPIPLPQPPVGLRLGGVIRRAEATKVRNSVEEWIPTKPEA